MASAEPLLSEQTGRDFLLGAIYHVEARFSHLPRFLKLVAAGFGDLAYSAVAVRTALDEKIRELDSVDFITDVRHAEQIVLRGDLMRIRSVLDSEEVVRAIEDYADVERSLTRVAAAAVAALQDIGVHTNDIAVNVVDQLPEPFADRPYSVLTADEGDHQAHGIEPGVYYLRSGLKPFYSHFLLCHEAIHFVLGERSPDLIARSLEEGIAEVLGAMYLSSEILGRDVTRNLFIYNRLSSDYDLFWEQYLDATRQAVLLLQEYGISGLADLLCAGRDAVKRAEDLLFSDRVQGLELNRGEAAPAFLLSLAWSLTMAYPRATIVSPAAVLVAPHAYPGSTVREIAQAARMSTDLCLEALHELADRVCLLNLRRDDVSVLWSDAPRRVETLRYELLGG